MATEVDTKTATVALIGNPNTGKSTLFSVLAGVHQHVGNYPGVTVEKKTGTLVAGERQITLVDLPGTYSLAPRSPDEMLTVDLLLGRLSGETAPDAVLCVLDASNLPRNLYLVSQIMEIGLATIVVLNMSDVATRKGVRIDVDLLQKRLEMPVIATQANKQIGVDEIRKLLATLDTIERPNPPSVFPDAFDAEVTAIQTRLSHSLSKPIPTSLAERYLLDTSGYFDRDLLADVDSDTANEIRAFVTGARGRLNDAGVPIPAVEATARYGRVAKLLDGVIESPPVAPASHSDRIDRIVTHRLWGSLFFLVLMAVTFQAVFSWAGPTMDGIESVVGWFGDQVADIFAEGPLQSLLVDGVIAGVGAVLVFLPQILLLFLFIAVLEDCGYMARAAYLMDKLMSKIGLSGKSFIPLLSSFACAVPGIMATRVIENRRDRLVTILVAPLMSCSARLPVYTLLVRAFLPDRTYFGGWFGLHGLTMVAMYVIGMVVAVGVAFVLKKTILAGPTPPFVMELPGYKMPSATVVGRRLFDSGWAFVRQAGTLIFAVTVLVWAAAYFPRNAELEREYDAQIEALYTEDQRANVPATAAVAEEVSQIKNARQGALIQQSYLGRAGQWIEPAVRPLGWDWRIGCGVIASFPAREVVIGTLGVIYNLGAETDEESLPLRDRLQAATWDGTDRPVFTIPVALSVMVFFALCAQCVATLAVIKRETKSWRWPIFSFVYMTVLAYVGALLTYQVGTRFFM